MFKVCSQHTSIYFLGRILPQGKIQYSIHTCSIYFVSDETQLPRNLYAWMHKNIIFVVFLCICCFFLFVSLLRCVYVLFYYLFACIVFFCFCFSLQWGGGGREGIRAEGGGGVGFFRKLQSVWWRESCRGGKDTSLLKTSESGNICTQLKLASWLSPDFRRH